MNEIEKLYKLAGVKKITLFKPKHSITLGDYDEEYIDYPLFTAEKQLKIIKLISKQGKVIIENWETDNKGFNVVFRANSNLRYITLDSVTRKTFKEALAQIINDIWQDLTEEEKQQIKEIL